MLRDDLAVYLSTDLKKRRQIKREILALEEQELGIPRRVNPVEERQRAKSQLEYAQRIAHPLNLPNKLHSNFLKAPRSLRSAGGSRSSDVLFSTNRDGTFWVYGMKKVTHATLGSLFSGQHQHTVATPDEIRRAPICQSIRRQVDHLISVASTRERFGLIFDLISTSKIIGSGIPHEIGSFIYEYIEEAHYEKTGLKFAFVGITDNVNCCAARDVFCRDDLLNGKYIGDTKRPFDALDNVHMFVVFPGHKVEGFFVPLATDATNLTATSASPGGGGASPDPTRGSFFLTQDQTIQTMTTGAGTAGNSSPSPALGEGGSSSSKQQQGHQVGKGPTLLSRQPSAGGANATTKASSAAVHASGGAVKGVRALVASEVQRPASVM